MYLLRSFADVDLPVGSPRHTAGTMQSQQRVLRTLNGGVYDAVGAGQAAADLPFTLVYDCKATGSTAAALRATLDALRALRGVEATLYREALDDGTRQWSTARCIAVDYDTEARHSHGLYQPLTMTWLVKTAWRGVLHDAAWYLDDSEYLESGLYLDTDDRYALDASPKTLTINNGGNTANDHVKLTIEAGATPMTMLEFVCGSCHLVWSGTLAATKTLTINCAPALRSVYNDGIAAWNQLTFGANHASEAWMRMERGDNTLVVTRTGGGNDTYLTVRFSDTWE